MRVILGVDPGVATVGFGVISSLDTRENKLISCGAITTPAGLALSIRLSQIYHDMLELIEKFKPDGIAVEELFFKM